MTKPGMGSQGRRERRLYNLVTNIAIDSPTIIFILCIKEKFRHCVCLLYTALNKDLFVSLTKGNKLCVANKPQ